MRWNSKKGGGAALENLLHAGGHLAPCRKLWGLGGPCRPSTSTMPLARRSQCLLNPKTLIPKPQPETLSLQSADLHDTPSWPSAPPCPLAHRTASGGEVAGNCRTGASGRATWRPGCGCAWPMADEVLLCSIAGGRRRMEASELQTMV